MQKTCCEEMRELVRTLDPDVKNGVYWDGERVDEVNISPNSPNIIFRFCPYCGAPVGEKGMNNPSPFTQRIAALVFNKEIDEAKGYVDKNAILEDAIQQLRKMLRAAGSLLEN